MLIGAFVLIDGFFLKKGRYTQVYLGECFCARVISYVFNEVFLLVETNNGFLKIQLY